MGFRLIPLDDNMKRINQLLIVILTIIILSSFLHVSSANPFLPRGTIGLEPNPPLVNVQSPKENQTFEKASITWLNFSITKPITTWNYTGTSFFKEGEIAHTFGEIDSINYSLDETNFNITGKHMYEESGILYYSIPIEQLLEGWHTISVMAEGNGHYGELQGDVYIGSGYSMSTLPSKTVNSVVEINFMVDDVNITPFNTLTSPLYLLPLTVVILVVTFLFLGYRRHRKPISQNKPNV
jgi:hypothetical protein